MKENGTSTNKFEKETTMQVNEPGLKYRFTETPSSQVKNQNKNWV